MPGTAKHPWSRRIEIEAQVQKNQLDHAVWAAAQLDRYKALDPFVKEWCKGELDRAMERLKTIELFCAPNLVAFKGQFADCWFVYDPEKGWKESAITYGS